MASGCFGRAGIWARRCRSGSLARMAFPYIARHAAERGWKLFFLGAGPGIAAKAAAILQERYPGLIVAGAFGGSPVWGRRRPNRAARQQQRRRYFVCRLRRARAGQMDRAQFAPLAGIDGDGRWRIAGLHRRRDSARAGLDAAARSGVALSLAAAALALAAHAAIAAFCARRAATGQTLTLNLERAPL